VRVIWISSIIVSCQDRPADALAVVAAHLEQRAARRLEVAVQVAEADAGLAAREPQRVHSLAQDVALQLERARQPLRVEQQAGGRRLV
jgi:tellurite resistance protein